MDIYIFIYENGNKNAILYNHICSLCLTSYLLPFKIIRLYITKYNKKNKKNRLIVWRWYYYFFIATKSHTTNKYFKMNKKLKKKLN
jgi:hypothetical protein